MLNYTKCILTILAFLLFHLLTPYTELLKLKRYRQPYILNQDIFHTKQFLNVDMQLANENKTDRPIKLDFFSKN